jgi:two-component system, NarL family, sensor histidine kinase DesK
VDPEHASDDGPLAPLDWWPMIFSIFIVFFPLAMLRRGDVTPFDWTLTGLAVVTFVLLVAEAVACWQRRSSFIRVPVALAMIGFLLSPYDYTAEVFFLFAAVIFPWAVNGNVQRCVIFALLMIYVEAFASSIQPVPASRKLWLIDVPLLTIGTVAASLWIVRTTLSLQRLACIAVRERITRDLNDVLGNALSLIALKAEQAMRLLSESSELERIRRDVADAETRSRQALADVRHAIRRYRSETIEADTSGRIDWSPMIFTIYIVFLPLGFWRAGGGTGFEWMLVLAGVLLFLALAAIAVIRWQRRRSFTRVVLLLALLGVAFAHWTPSAMIFIVAAASLVPWAANGDIGRTVGLNVVLIAVAFFIGEWNAFLHPDAAVALRELWWINVPIFTAICAVGCLLAVRASLRHLGLAKVAERERIARDLHDVLGHTLSVITLKSELAGRLLTDPSNLERAGTELAEVSRIARQALADVTHTILGQRLESIETELERATSTLRTAGITVECQREATHIDARHESILGLALREAVTNVVRHAEARTCCIRLHRMRDVYVLEVQDDGRGGAEREGFGLRGMRERIEALGGSVLREISAGTRLTVCLPVAAIPA